MLDAKTILIERFRQAIAAGVGPEHADVDPLIGPSTNLRFGDYQANVAMSLAKKLATKPRDVAQKIVDAALAQGAEVWEKLEIAGPGFINIHLSPAFLQQHLAGLLADPRLGVPQPQTPQTVVVDYSGPNVAKEMHVGHLRATIIGDAIARTLSFQGHQVIRQNHLGDWGTQFGMLIEHLLDLKQSGQLTGQNISDLNALYQQAKKRDDDDAGFAERARKRVVLLQGGDAQTLALWQQLVEESERHFQAIYRRLGVLLTKDDIRGESFYNSRLPQVIDALKQAGLLEESQGALVVFLPGFADREGNPLPMIVRKSDGGYLYATTDLAGALFRIRELHAQRIVYVTDARQSGHFAMVFATLRQAGWAPADAVRLDHVPFGSVLGKDNKPFKTREGGTVRLADLLDEAQARAAAVVLEKNREMAAATQQEVAQVVGIGALKYADLSVDRIKDYVFDWERMLSFDGNTAPYLINAYVRIQSIFRKGQVDPVQLAPGPLAVGTLPERALALKLLQFPAVVQAVGESLEPHRLCNYLYEIAGAYHQFYEACPVLTAETDSLKQDRLRLIALTARTLRQGLGLLGIQVIEQM